MRRLVVAVVCLAAASGCPGSDGTGSVSGRFPPECALPTPSPGLELGDVPTAFLFGGKADPILYQKTDAGFILGLNVGLSVEDALAEAKKVAATEGYEVIQEDNEGFEAELYLRKGRLVGVFQIRISRCNEASVVFLNIIDRRAGVPLPTRTPGSGTPPPTS